MRGSATLLLAAAWLSGSTAVALGQAQGSDSAVYWFRPSGKAPTIASMRRLALEHGFGSHCEPVLVAEFHFGKDGPRSAQTVRLGIISSHVDGQRLRVEADGVVYDVGVLRPMDFVEYSWCRSMPPTVGVELDCKQFLAIAGSQQIVLRIGEQAIPLDREQRDSLHSLAVELESTALRPVLTRPPN